MAPQQTKQSTDANVDFRQNHDAIMPGCPKCAAYLAHIADLEARISVESDNYLESDAVLNCVLKLLYSEAERRGRKLVRAKLKRKLIAAGHDPEYGV